MRAALLWHVRVGRTDGVDFDLGGAARLWYLALRATSARNPFVFCRFTTGRFMARVTVEDCLEQIPNRFALVHLGVKRARELMKDAEPLLETDNRECVTALREIAGNRITIAQDLDDVLQKSPKSTTPRRGRRRRR